MKRKIFELQYFQIVRKEDDSCNVQYIKEHAIFIRDALRKLSNRFANSKQLSALYLLLFSDVFHQNSLEVQCKTSECFMVGDGPAAFDPTELFFASFFPISFFAVILYLLLYSSTCHHIIIFVHHCICGRISVFVAGWAGFPEAVVDYGQPLQEQTISTVPQCNANVEAKIFWFLLLMLKYCIFKLKYICYFQS